MIRNSEIPLAILISGSGTTMNRVIEAHKTGELTGVVPIAVISSKPDAAGLVKAQQHGIKTFVVSPKEYATKEEFGDHLLDTLRRVGAHLFFQMGWLPKTPPTVVEAFGGRGANQHPGPLDPGRLDFGGKGMYGARVIAARLAYALVTGEDHWTEATTHQVTHEYDQGRTISVRRLELPWLLEPVTFAYLRQEPQMFIDTTRDVQARLLPLEHENVIRALQMFADFGWHADLSRDHPLIPAGNEHVVYGAKALAIQMFPNG